ncbi:MAG TPA: Ni/Fe hydrogenase subunit gamma [Gammaproteobacteria bacterium]|nr:Ni/Fe hydrogenase subunit gamma [Gammaproteobacteria bacterium]
MAETSPHLPRAAEIVERVEEARDIFTLRLRLCEPAAHAAYRFRPGQFNMLYLFGVGEVPISIVSDPEDETLLDHTIRAVGRVTRGLARLGAGARIGIRGPYGRGWPLEAARGRDLLVITGGLGCAPSVSVIDYVMRRRARFGHLTIMQGVKHYNDLLWRPRYEQWARQPRTTVLLAADQGGPVWPWHVGPVTELFDQAHIIPGRTLAMICGPEGMMQAVVAELRRRGVPDGDIWLSMERNMQCALGQCGHCQYGPHFVCRNGPVFPLSEIEGQFGIRGL